ncbi:MAG: pyruvate kinase [Thermoplasmata archaeon]
MKKTRIICTMGPACRELSILEKMMIEGMDVARLNFSHGSHDEHKKAIETIRTASRNVGKPVAILADLQGPKIRTGKLEDKNKPLVLKKGDILTITIEEYLGKDKKIGTDYKEFPKDVKPGNTVLFADGALISKVVAVREKEVDLEMLNDGELGSHKGINLPGVKVSSPALSDKDIEDLVFALQNDVDYVALSFVRKPEDIMKCKQIIYKNGKNTPVIAKIEKDEALEKIDKILEVADGIMVARGDLGVEMELEKVPFIQKMLIHKCNMVGKPVIVATQMLESMITAPRPTRAEASDIVNAILDGTDCIMLSGETAVSVDPVNSVRTMATIAKEADMRAMQSGTFIERAIRTKFSMPSSVAHAACKLAEELFAEAIVAFTESGTTARFVSKYRPRTPIIACTPHDSTLRTMAMFWGVKGIKVEWNEDFEEAAGDGACKAGRYSCIHHGRTFRPRPYQPYQST